MARVPEFEMKNGGKARPVRHVYGLTARWWAALFAIYAVIDVVVGAVLLAAVEAGVAAWMAWQARKDTETYRRSVAMLESMQNEAG